MNRSSAWSAAFARVLFALAILAPLLANSAHAQTVWTLATEFPASNISGVGLTTFAKAVAAHTHGAVLITPKLDNEAKISSGEMILAAQAGRVTGGDAFAGPLEATDALFGLPSLPFLVQSVEASRALNTKARPLYEKALAARGLTLLYMTIWPSTGLWSAQAVNTVVDIQALRARSYDNNSAEVLRAAGARANYLPFNDAIAKVKAKELNAILTSGDGGAGRRLWDDLRVFTSINYAIPISLAFVRSDALSALPNEQRNAVMAAAAETEASQFALLATRTSENYARMRDNGVAIVDPPPDAVLAALKQGAAATIEGWKRKVSPKAAALADEATR